MFDSTYRYTTLLFDADGTLFDYQKASWEALRRTLAQFALPFSQELFALYQEKKNQALWELYELGKVTKDQLEIQRFCTSSTPRGWLAPPLLKRMKPISATSARAHIFFPALWS